MPIVLAVIVGGMTLVVLFKPIFGSRDEFMECLRLALTPNIISMFRGEWGEDFIAEFKMTLWLGASGALGFAAFYVTEQILT